MVSSPESGMGASSIAVINGAHVWALLSRRMHMTAGVPLIQLRPNRPCNPLSSLIAAVVRSGATAQYACGSLQSHRFSSALLPPQNICVRSGRRPPLGRECHEISARAALTGIVPPAVPQLWISASYPAPVYQSFPNCHIA